MTETDIPTLQSVLKEKYDISEKIYAEGRFVSLLGDHGIGLVCLGLSMESLVIARILLNNEVMDYDVLSIIPLTVLSLSYDFITQKLKIRSQYKPTQMYQLCSSANQAEVWDNFTSVIRNVNQQEKGDTWQTASLKPVPSQSCSQISYLENIHDVNKCVQPQCARLSESSVSLPSVLPSNVSHLHGDVVFKSNSVDCINVHFESFVNDVNVSNNNIECASDISLDIDENAPSSGKLSRFFKRLFSCGVCITKQEDTG
ncbi:hypothetical protein ACF0H5_005320 [Mactra antiquata]